MSERICLAPRCQASPNGEQLFCWDHWKAIPASLRKTISFLANNPHTKNGLEDALANAIEQIASPRPRAALDPEFSWPFKDETRG